MRYRTLPLLLSLLLLSVVSLLAALAAGSIRVPIVDVIAAITGDVHTMGADVVMKLRLPRALGTFACGGLLALAGALMQVLLRNPLADPHVLGVTGGAAVGALLALLLGMGVVGVNAGSFAGAFLAMLLVFGLAHGDGGWTRSRLLLTGVIIAAGCGAVVALILSIAPEQALRGMLFWLMGDAAHITNPWPAILLLVFGLLLAWPFARELNLLTRGDQFAQSLGVRVQRLRGLVYFLGALLTAGAVTTAGSIGFVGLVVPHLVRLVAGNDQRLLLPAAALAGGSLLTLADTLARTVVAPHQLPVGVLTALIGVPLFLYLLTRKTAATRDIE
jgi:iron complex transport system permease protein